jgi:gas vesicle protein
MWLNIIKFGGYAMFLKEVMDRVVTTRRAHERQMRINTAKNLALGATIGSALGATAGLLFAPRSGRETREEIARRAHEGVDAVRENVYDTRARLSSTLREKSENWRSAAEQCADIIKTAAKAEAESLSKEIGD